MIPRLACCKPTAQSGSSSQIVHNFGCTKHPEGTPLTPAEYAEWRGHPSARSHETSVSLKESVTTGPHLRVVDGTKKRSPRRRPERWFTGITPELEDFS